MSSPATRPPIPAPQWPWCNPRRALPVAALLAATLLGGCPKDPLGPDNRMAMLAFSQCRHDQALVMADAALARGDANTRVQALLLKAAVLQDRGGADAASALYPEIDAAWEVAKRRALTPEWRAQQIALYQTAGRNDRQARGLDPDCRGVTTPAPVPATPAPAFTPGEVPQRDPAAVNPALPALD